MDEEEIIVVKKIVIVCKVEFKNLLHNSVKYISSVQLRRRHSIKLFRLVLSIKLFVSNKTYFYRIIVSVFGD